VLQNKPELLNFIIWAYVSSKKIIDIHIFPFILQSLIPLECGKLSYMIQALIKISKHSPFADILSFSEL
jgi:hypothetical protein